MSHPLPTHICGRCRRWMEPGDSRRYCTDCERDLAKLEKLSASRARSRSDFVRPEPTAEELENA